MRRRLSNMARQAARGVIGGAKATSPASDVQVAAVAEGRRNLSSRPNLRTGTNRTSGDVRSSVAIGRKADMAVTSADFRV
jgi:hypothetical protein